MIREELDEDQWKRYKIFQETLGGRPYLFNGGLPPGGSDGSGESGIDYTVPAEALTDNEFAAIYEEAKKYVGTPYVWGAVPPKPGLTALAIFAGFSIKTATMWGAQRQMAYGISVRKSPKPKQSPVIWCSSREPMTPPA